MLLSTPPHWLHGSMPLQRRDMLLFLVWTFTHGKGDSSVAVVVDIAVVVVPAVAAPSVVAVAVACALCDFLTSAVRLNVGDGLGFDDAVDVHVADVADVVIAVLSLLTNWN